LLTHRQTDRQSLAKT